MQSGRSLDIDVARRVARLAVIIDTDGENHRMVDPKRNRIVPVPYYSTETNDTYLLINMLQGQGYACRISSNVDTGEIAWTVEFIKGDETHRAVSSESFSHAACVAALTLIGD